MLRDYRLDPPEPVAVAHCHGCGEEMYNGEDAYNVSGHLYCVECVKPTTVEGPEREDETY